MEENSVSWQAPEFIYYEKEAGWYLGLIGLSAVFIIIALFQKNFLFAFFILVAGILMGSWAKKVPREIEYVIDAENLQVGDKKIVPFKNMLGFAIIDGHPDGFSELIVRTKGQINTDLKILLPTSLGEKVRASLPSSVPEIEYEESASDRLAKIIRF